MNNGAEVSVIETYSGVKDHTETFNSSTDQGNSSEHGPFKRMDVDIVKVLSKKVSKGCTTWQ